MDIEIRRNRDIKFEFELSKEQRETILDFFKPKVIDEMVEQMLDENNRLKREIAKTVLAGYYKYGVQTLLTGNFGTTGTMILEVYDER